MQVLLIMAIIIATLAVVFTIQNVVPITVSFLTWRFESSLALVLLITLAFGILISLLVSVPSVIKRMKIISSQKKRIKELEKSSLEGIKKEKESEIKNGNQSEKSEPTLEQLK